MGNDIDSVVRAAQAGDEAAFDELVLRLQGELRISVALRASSAELVDEVVQATFVTAYEQLSRYRLEGTFLPWLKGIARNRLREELRARARGVALDVDALESLIAGRIAAADDPQDSAHDERLLERLQQCLAHLRPEGRRLLLARYGEGCSLPNLAQRFRRRATALASMIKRLRVSLRDCIDREALS